MLIEQNSNLLSGYAHNVFYSPGTGEGDAQFSEQDFNNNPRVSQIFRRINNYFDRGVPKTIIDPDSLVVFSVFAAFKWPCGQFLGFRDLLGGYQQQQLEALDNVATVVRGTDPVNHQPVETTNLMVKRGVSFNNYSTNMFLNLNIQMAQHVIHHFQASQDQEIIRLVQYLQEFVNLGPNGIKTALLQYSTNQDLMNFDKVFQVCSSNQAVDVAAYYKPIYMYILNKFVDIHKRKMKKYTIRYRVVRRVVQGIPQYRNVDKRLDQTVSTRYLIPLSVWRDALHNFVNTYYTTMAGFNLGRNANIGATLNPILQAINTLFHVDIEVNPRTNLEQEPDLVEAILNTLNETELAQFNEDPNPLNYSIKPDQLNFGTHTKKIFNNMIECINNINTALEDFNRKTLPIDVSNFIARPTVAVDDNYWDLNRIRDRISNNISPPPTVTDPNLDFIHVPHGQLNLFGWHLNKMKSKHYLSVPFTNTVLWALQRGMLTILVNTLATVQPNQDIMQVVNISQVHNQPNIEEKVKFYSTYVSDGTMPFLVQSIKEQEFPKIRDANNNLVPDPDVQESQLINNPFQRRIAKWGNDDLKLVKMVLLGKMPKATLNYEIFRTVGFNAPGRQYCRRMEYSLLAIYYYLRGNFVVTAVPYCFYTPKAHGPFPVYHELFF